MSLDNIAFLSRQCARDADPTTARRMLIFAVRFELHDAGAAADVVQLREIIDALLTALDAHEGAPACPTSATAPACPTSPRF